MGLEIKKNITRIRTRAAFAAIGLAGLATVLNPSNVRANNDCGDAVKINGNEIVVDPSINGGRVSFTYSTGIHARATNPENFTGLLVTGPEDTVGTCTTSDNRSYTLGFELPAQQRALLFSEVQNPS